MQLSPFITSHMDAILADWETFARRNAPEQTPMSDLALRDHAAEILEAVAFDLCTPQSELERFTKSQGDSDATDGPRTAATIHGALRQGHDYSLLQLSAEFRALRATVLRQWLPTVREVDTGVVEDMVRFNEAIDQALAQSIIAYSEHADLSRDLFIAVLGHDLRSPLANVAIIGEMLRRDGLGAAQVKDLGVRTSRSARFMNHMVEDLLGYTRVQMGRGIPVTPIDCDLTDLVHAAVADAAATYPDTHFDIVNAADLHARVDPVRAQQLLTNLLVNAAQHGQAARPVAVEVSGDGDAVTLRVTNHGTPLTDEERERIFKPLVQLGDAHARPTSLGLGLYIAREIALAHGGGIEVTSSVDDGTTFEARLPRDDGAFEGITPATAGRAATTSVPSMR